jgi:hypothetical protein
MNQGLTRILTPSVRNAPSVSLRRMPDRVSRESISTRQAASQAACDGWPAIEHAVRIICAHLH